MPRLSRPSFIVQATSHLLLHEEDAARQLLGFTPLVVGAKDRPLSPADVEKELSRLAAVGARPCCILPYNLLAFFDMSILAMSLASFSGCGGGAAASEPA